MALEDEARAAQAIDAALKRSFYENHTGSSVREINQITLVILAAHALFSGLKTAGFLGTAADEMTWGFVCYILNIVLAVTLYNGRGHFQLLLMYGGGAMLVTLWAGLNGSSARRGSQDKSAKKRLGFLSAYRAMMMLLTVVAIFAVDTAQFPRRYAKVETWGTSLMDLGVGSFVFSSGLVSARLPQSYTFLQGFQQTGILGLMGIVRALLVKGSGYHEHTSEYGVHWNFFLTLALLPPLLPLSRLVWRRIPSFLVQGILVAILYEMALQLTGLQNWVLLAQRDTLISANKEGLASFGGYIAIFLMGLDAGALVLKPTGQNRKASTILLLTALLFWFAYSFMTTLPIPKSLRRQGKFQIGATGPWQASRRLANAPYIFWVAAHNYGFLLALMLIEQGFTWVGTKFSKPDSAKERRKQLVQKKTGKVVAGENGKPSKATTINESLLLNLVNKHSLKVFLFANLLTGVLNLSLGTKLMKLSDMQGVGIILAYSLVTCAAAFILDRVNLPF
ncbi:GWT1-domain-containing protein [Protomyces lactucae-debilis]|uniref:GPI-anchored wall transfer protein n=1 Tax=Protomyces lactucae-debilis TaxID=2754530 RepID=A0A1Y2F3T3_PROLT|nr:GWT1-domain-containing protein [Protomyces lactucae-debilis]ORY78568.1 GWT1-domain-containing protein [Protomyces lactucae-debilis]